MRVAVTGASGLIGRSFVPALRHEGLEVIAIGRDEARLRRLFGSEVDRRVTDYDEESLVRALDGAEALVHLAAVRIADPTRDEAAHVERNRRIAESVMRAAAETGVAKVVKASSIMVYSTRNRVPYTEDDLPRPDSVNGISNLACERACRVWASKSGREPTMLRISRVFGFRDRTGRDLMIPTFIERARRGLPLIVWGAGRAARDTLYVEDVVRALLAALAPAAPGGVFNIGAGRATSTLELAEAINRAWSNEAGIRFDLGRPDDSQAVYMDCSKAQRRLGWKPEWSLDDALADLRRRYEVAESA